MCGTWSTPVITTPIPGMPGCFAFTTRAGLRVDVVLETPEDTATSTYSCRVRVLDRDGFALPAAFDDDRAPDVGRMQAIVMEFLRQSAIFPAAVVAREDWLLGQVAVHQLPADPLRPARRVEPAPPADGRQAVEQPPDARATCPARLAAGAHCRPRLGDRGHDRRPQSHPDPRARCPRVKPGASGPPTPTTRWRRTGIATGSDSWLRGGGEPGPLSVAGTGPRSPVASRAAQVIVIPPSTGRVWPVM